MVPQRNLKGRRIIAAPQEVLDLVERFDRNREAYQSGQYKETQVRLEFIDRFFKALGWDVHNERGYAEAYKDVVHEDVVKIGGATKAPDYCFRIGGTRKFFLEAKKPSVNIRDDISAAFQLRRYAWSAKLPLSILTDFHEFAVYDSRIKPDKADKASIARVLYLGYAEYVQRWDEIASIFSRDAILKGSFDKYAESSKAKRGTAEVDDAFLKEIEAWRESLAHNLALRNTGLGRRELNFAVQRTIDRLIFLRICEDRGIEEYGRLMALQNGGQVYERLCQLFRLADERYNSGLFHFQREKDRSEDPDDLTLNLIIDDKPLKDIIKSLYYPDSPYEFSVLPADILGQVYEQFLGKVIRLTAGHRAIVEDKPEVKKAGGVYYTPTYIVDYIVKHTVGKLLEGKKSRQAASLRVLDPSCGSGSFLIGAYQYLLDWHRDEYVAEGPQRHVRELYQGPGGDWRLATAERKRILLNNIYGVDIDPQAVETTKLSLLLKVLEGESGESIGKTLRMFHERALPDLGENIKCGNSLIGPDFYDGQQASFLDEEERYNINAFDWSAEFPKVFSMQNPGFDAVIGNPPYDVMEKDRRAASWPHAALSEYVKMKTDYQQALGGKLNLFRFFILRSLALTRKHGRYGMIVPLALLADITCAKTRRHLITNSEDLLADCFPQKDNPRRRVFLKAKLSTVIVTCSRSSPQSDESAAIQVRVYPWNKFDDPYRTCKVRLADTRLLDTDNAPIPLADSRDWELCKRVHSSPRVTRLGEAREFSVARGEINQTVYRQFIVDDPTKTRLLKGVEVGRFRLRDKLSQGHREWFDRSRFLELNAQKAVVQGQRIATQRITGVDERLRIVATLVDPQVYFADSTNSISASAPSSYRLEYVLGLLNSRLFQWRFKITSSNNNVGTNELNSMPFRNIAFSDFKDKGRHDHMVELVEHALTLSKQLVAAKTGHDKTILQRQIDATDWQIDRLVYQFYELTDEEIELVEAATG